MTDKLDEWRRSIPYTSVNGQSPCDLLLELGYWQTIITIYRQNIAIPNQLVATSSVYRSKSEQPMDQASEELNIVYSRMYEACQKVIRIYRALQSMELINIAHFVEDQIFTAGKLQIDFMHTQSFLILKRFSFLVHNLEFRAYPSQVGMCVESALHDYSFLQSVYSNLRLRFHQSFQSLDSIVLMVTAVLDQMSDQSPTARISRTVFQQMGATTIQYFLSTYDTDHNSRPFINDQPYILTPEGSAQDTASPFTSDLISYWKPQCSSLDFLDRTIPSLNSKVGVNNDQFDKVHIFEDSSQSNFSFDTPDLLSYLATGEQGIESFSKMTYGSKESNRDSQSTLNELDSSYVDSFGISLQLEREQFPGPNTSIPGIDDELLGDFLVEWADSGSPYV